MKTNVFLKYFVGMLVVFGLLGCSAKHDLYLSANEVWKLQSDYEIDSSVFGVLEDTLRTILQEVFEISADDLDIEPGFQGIAEYTTLSLKQRGYQAEYRMLSNRSDRQKFRITIEGQSYQQLRDLMPGYISIDGAQPEQENQIQTYHLVWDLKELSMIGMVMQQKFTLHASSIISSNADDRGFGTATWRNPVVIDATFRPGFVFEPQWWMAAVAGAVAVLILIILVAAAAKNRKKRCPHCYQPIPMSTEYCPYCGQPVNEIADPNQNWGS